MRFTPEEIITKLEEAFTVQGLKVQLVTVNENSIVVNMERFAPGLPAAFMVQAIQGTFKRYCPEITEVILGKYEGLKEPVRGQSFSFKGTPGLDLTSAPKNSEEKALENFYVMMKHLDYKKFLIKGLKAEALPILEKFCSDHLLFHHAWQLPEKDGISAENTLVVHRQHNCPEQTRSECCKGETSEFVPAQILLLESLQAQAQVQAHSDKQEQA